VVKGAAPYLRFAYEHQWGRSSLEAGVYGADFTLYPGGAPGASVPLTGPGNRFRDIAEDFQYQYIADKHLITVAGTRIHENMTLNASADPEVGPNLHNDLTTTRVWGTYYYERRLGGTAGYFSTVGSTDAALYTPGTSPGVIGSATGRPDTKGWMVEANYVPWLNTKISLQYTAYQKFNGGSSNYDGFGRNASDNNTLYALIWFAY
jgi:hypothetical protein